MCEFFSLVSDGQGRIMFFDWEKRQKCLEGTLNYNPDSHTSIADYYGYKGRDEDLLNKYEYNPLLKAFKKDHVNRNLDDSKDVEAFCRNLDFKTIVPYVHYDRKIVHPLRDIKTTKVVKKDIELLKKWGSVLDSVRDSVGGSVGDSVGGSVLDSVRDSVGGSVRGGVCCSVWDSVGDSVGGSVLDSVCGSVWDSVGDSVGGSVGDSVRDSVCGSVRGGVRAYVSSFFVIDNWKYIRHKKGVNPLHPAIDLWNRGLVPSFDKEKWRLHGYEGKILWKGEI